MLPSDFPAWYHIWYYYRTWRDDGTWEHINTLRRRDIRTKAGREPEPSVGIIDSQSVPATEMGGEKRFNPAKQVKGHVMIDTYSNCGKIAAGRSCSVAWKPWLNGYHWLIRAPRA